MSPGCYLPLPLGYIHVQNCEIFQFLFLRLCWNNVTLILLLKYDWEFVQMITKTGLEKMLHNICISAVAVSLRWATRGCGPLINMNIIYGLELRFWMVPEIWRLLGTERGQEYAQGTTGQCHWMRLIIRNSNIYGLGVGFWDIRTFKKWRGVCVGGGGGAWTQGTPSWCHWIHFIKEQQYIWFRGRDLNGFWDIRQFILDVSYKEQEYIWFIGGELNSFWDIRPFMKWSGWGMPPGDPQSTSVDASYHKEQEYNMVGFPRYKAFYGMDPLVCPLGWILS